MTNPAARPRRSVLYMPGSNTRAMQKGRELPADALILDLEDSVAPEAKIEARDLIKAALDEGGYGSREIGVRTNGFDTEWGKDDVAAVAQMKCHAVVLPKVETAEMVLDVVAILEKAGAPEKFNATITLAFLSLIAERMAGKAYTDFAEFETANPDLASMAVLGQWYSKERMTSPTARKQFLMPDRVA